LAQAGNEAAFRELVLRRQGAVRDLLRRLSGNAALADDLAQQAFLQAWRSLKTLREPAAFKGWLRRIAIHVWLQHVRRGRLRDDGDFDLAVETVADPIQSAPEGARLDIERALSRLSGAERLCVVLSHAAGLSHPEIAEATGLPLGTVKSHLARGGSKLKSFLGIGA
jgi:RNA polymerase sigma factor (sigma-70 family)